jgi:hypothetical protein
MAMAAITILAFLKIGIFAAFVLAAFFLSILPATVAILGLEGSVLRAINPVEWLHVIRGLGLYYFLVLGLIGLEVVIVTSLGRLPLGLIFQTAAVMFGMLSAISVLAGALYERREQLGLATWISPERDAELQRRDEHTQDEKVVTEAYGLLRANHHQESWERLQVWLHSQDFNSHSYRWLVEQADKWEDRRYAGRLAEDWVERVMASKKPGEALRIVVERLRIDPGFRPKSAADTLNLAQLAARGGGSPRTAKTLLSDFSGRFPGDPRLDIASALARHLS